MAITSYFLDANWEYREVLLGFEPLEGAHSGDNLGSVLSSILTDYSIADRVIAITTDNASNNTTLIRKVETDHLGVPFIRIPCMAHVIQLSLKSLLATIKGNPENEQVDIVWSDDRLVAIKANHIDIANTLTKARTFAIYINASSQRKDAFIKLQNRATLLVLI
jgi:hypothetical protein